MPKGAKSLGAWAKGGPSLGRGKESGQHGTKRGSRTKSAHSLEPEREATECPKEECQKNEIEAMECIFVEDFELLRDVQPFQFRLRLEPCPGMPATSNHVGVSMVVTMTYMYPDQLPHIEMERARGLNVGQLSDLGDLVRREADRLLGAEMVLQLAEVVKDYLVSHNQPPLEGSLHEQMKLTAEAKQAKRKKKADLRRQKEMCKQQTQQNKLLHAIAKTLDEQESWRKQAFVSEDDQLESNGSEDAENKEEEDQVVPSMIYGNRRSLREVRSSSISSARACSHDLSGSENELESKEDDDEDHEVDFIEDSDNEEEDLDAYGFSMGLDMRGSKTGRMSWFLNCKTLSRFPSHPESCRFRIIILSGDVPWFKVGVQSNPARDRGLSATMLRQLFRCFAQNNSRVSTSSLLSIA